MQSSEQRLGYLEGILSIIINTLLFGLKLWAGRSASSVAVVADAWHTLSDTATSLVVIAGFWIASRPPDTEHPFGHGRAELVGAIVIGTLLALVGVNFLKESYNHLQERAVPTFSILTFVVFGASTVLKEGMAQFSFWAGRKLNSRALAADGWHHRSDAIASLLILVGAAFGTRIWWIDVALGFAVSGLIIYAAVEIVRDAAGAVMGEKPDAATERKIREIVTAGYPEVTRLHHFHLHRYGNHAEITLHACVDSDLTVGDSHRVASAIESSIRTELHIEPTVHVEPCGGSDGSPARAGREDGIAPESG